MNDKYMQEDLNAMVARLLEENKRMADCMERMATVMEQQAELYRNYLDVRMGVRSELPIADPELDAHELFLAHQQPRRDGDNFTTVPPKNMAAEAMRNATPPTDGDRKTGDL